MTRETGRGIAFRSSGSLKRGRTFFLLLLMNPLSHLVRITTSVSLTSQIVIIRRTPTKSRSNSLSRPLCLDRPPSSPYILLLLLLPLLEQYVRQNTRPTARQPVQLNIAPTVSTPPRLPLNSPQSSSSNSFSAKSLIYLIPIHRDSLTE